MITHGLLYLIVVHGLLYYIHFLSLNCSVYHLIIWLFYWQLSCLAFSLKLWAKIKQLLGNCPASDWSFSIKQYIFTKMQLLPRGGGFSALIILLVENIWGLKFPGESLGVHRMCSPTFPPAPSLPLPFSICIYNLYIKISYFSFSILRK